MSNKVIELIPKSGRSGGICGALSWVQELSDPWGHEIKWFNLGYCKIEIWQIDGKKQKIGGWDEQIQDGYNRPQTRGRGTFNTQFLICSVSRN